MTEVYLGEPPAHIKQWIIDHAQPQPSNFTDADFGSGKWIISFNAGDGSEKHYDVECVMGNYGYYSGDSESTFPISDGSTESIHVDVQHNNTNLLTITVSKQNWSDVYSYDINVPLTTQDYQTEIDASEHAGDYSMVFAGFIKIAWYR